MTRHDAAKCRELKAALEIVNSLLRHADDDESYRLYQKHKDQLVAQLIELEHKPRGNQGIDAARRKP